MQNKGFTLVELSIVLVIIGLIVGGVVGGQSLIDAAKKNKVISEIASYKVALNNFDMQYNALPGDMADATDYWPGTIDGDGNRQWDDPILEGLRAWEHLSLAELVDGKYDRSVSTQYLTGVSMPESPFGSRWHFVTGTITYYGKVLISGNTIKIADGDNNVHWHGGAGAIDSKALDKKMDDGVAQTGNVVGFSSSGEVCFDRGNPNANYYTDRNITRGCMLIFKLY